MQSPVLISASKLSPEALRGVVDEFVTREGTEYGTRDYSLKEKRAMVMRQIEANEVVIVFHSDTGTCNLVKRVDFERPKPGEIGSKYDRTMIAHLVFEDEEAAQKLKDAGFSDGAIASRASAMGMTADFIKKCRLSESRPAMRTCVKCDTKFLSAGPHNRLCSRCPAR
ncbi:MAG: YheU family protein [Myxococcales bacterium]|nr:YheU family protein [Myxococcales bacterium]